MTERQIEAELREIERLMSTNATQIEQWTTLVDRLSKELKEMGDVSNWLQVLEQTAGDIAETSKTLHS